MFSLKQIKTESKSMGCGWGKTRQGPLLATVDICPDCTGPEEVIESSVATTPLVLAVQWNHEHRDIIVGHLPFSSGTIVLPLCVVYQHFGQL